jgi:hypothetical protein
LISTISKYVTAFSKESNAKFYRSWFEFFSIYKYRIKLKGNTETLSVHLEARQITNGLPY